MEHTLIRQGEAPGRSVLIKDKEEIKETEESKERKEGRIEKQIKG